MKLNTNSILIALVAVFAAFPALNSSQVGSSSAPMASSYCAASSQSAQAQSSGATSFASTSSASSRGMRELLARISALSIRYTAPAVVAASTAAPLASSLATLTYTSAPAQQSSILAHIRHVNATEAAEHKASQETATDIHEWEAYVKEGNYDDAIDTNDISNAELKRRIEFYERAAEAGNKNACGSLGNFYRDTGNFSKAVKFFQAGARLKCGYSAHELGECYEEGKGVTRDQATAFTFYKQAEKYGCDVEELLLKLSRFYAGGIGGARRNLPKALDYLLRFGQATQEYDEPIFSLLYEKGIMVPKAPAKAKEYFEAAVKDYAERQAKELAGELATLSEETKAKRLQELESQARAQIRQEIDTNTDFFQRGVLLDCAGQMCDLCRGTETPFAKDDQISILSCWHPFCKDCLNTWRQTRGNICPTCLDAGDSSAKGRVEGTVL